MLSFCIVRLKVQRTELNIGTRTGRIVLCKGSSYPMEKGKHFLLLDSGVKEVKKLREKDWIRFFLPPHS